MQGRKETPAASLFIYSDPYAQLPRHEFYAALTRHLDLEWVREATAALYADGIGRPSLDPVVFVKLMLVSYFENIVADSELAFRVADSLTVRRFLGYGLAEATPERTTILKTRQRWPEEAFAAIFLRILEQLAEHGLVRGEQLGTDCRLVDANASMDSLRHRELGCSYSEFVKALYAQGSQLASAPDIAAKDAQRAGKASNADWVSATDPDAAVAVHADGHTALSYRVDATVDLETGAIVQIGVASGNVRDSVDLTQRLEEAQENLAAVGLTASVLTADRGHHDDENLVAVAEAGVTPILRTPARRGAPGFRESDFIYDEAADQYRCPAGQLLARRRDDRRGRRCYHAKGGSCRSCEHFGVCTRSRQGRRVTVSSHAAEVAANRERAQSEWGRQLLGRHRQRAEGPWSYSKLYGGLARINTRGGEGAAKKALLQGIGWNIMKLIAHLTGLRPRGKSEAKPTAAHSGVICAALTALRAFWEALATAADALHAHGHQISALRRLSIPFPRLRKIWLLSRGC
jgi:transposase